jgi:hypothetical protein
MKTLIKNLMAGMGMALIPVAANAIEVEDCLPGTLREKISDEYATATTLKVSGAVNVNDLMAIKEMPRLRELDLGDAYVDEYVSRKELLLGRKAFAANELPAYIFAFSTLESVILPKELESIGEGAFTNSAVASVEIPSTVRWIGDWAFYSSPLESATLPEALESVGKGAFAQCAALRSVAFPTSRGYSIGDEAFLGSSVGSLIVNTTTIGDYAFSQMPELQSATITNISNGDGMLFNNPALEYVDGKITMLGNYGAAECPALELENVKGSTFMERILTLGDYALADNGTATMVFDKLEGVGSHVFDGMTSLTGMNVYNLEGRVAAREEDSFEGINPASVGLYVNENHLTPWMADTQWSKFHIVSIDTGVVDEISGNENGIIYERTGDMVSISSGDILTGIIIYDASGKTLSVSVPNDNEAEINLRDFNADVMIIKAMTREGNLCKTVIR